MPRKASLRQASDAGSLSREPRDVEGLYERYFDFVWRSAKRLGVSAETLDDVVQDVFLVAHRRLDDFEGRSSAKTWLFGITWRIARDYRRSAARRGTRVPLSDVLSTLRAAPERPADRAHASRVLHAFLDTLDDAHRATFILAELEELRPPEIAEALGANLHTTYSRLRSARRQLAAFVNALERDGGCRG